MGMRKDWTTTKGATETLFKQGTAKEMLAKLSEGGAPPAYPFKFDKNLGPTLDKYEEAKKKNKAADATKHGTDAKKIIGQYEQLIKGKQTDVDKVDRRICAVLLQELNKMKGLIK